MIARAIDNLGMDINKTVIVSGIGCTGRTSGYFKTGTYHTTHGRAIAFAEGVKIANPELEVIVVSGLSSYRRQPPHPCLSKKHRHDCNMHKQLHVRNDWRTIRSNNRT